MHTFLSRLVLPLVAIGVIFGFTAHVALADAPTEVLTGGSDVSGPSNRTISITDLQVDGPATSTVPVHLYVATGTLSIVSTTGITFLNDVATGTSIYFSGLLPDVNTALASLQYASSSVGAIR